MDLMEKLNALEDRVTRLADLCETRKARCAALEDENRLLKEQVSAEKRKAAAAASEAEPLRRQLETERAAGEAMKKRIEKMLKELEDVPDDLMGLDGVKLAEGEVQEIDLDGEPEEDEVVPDEAVEEDADTDGEEIEDVDVDQADSRPVTDEDEPVLFPEPKKKKDEDDLI